MSWPQRWISVFFKRLGEFVVVLSYHHQNSWVPHRVLDVPAAGELLQSVTSSPLQQHMLVVTLSRSYIGSEFVRLWFPACVMPKALIIFDHFSWSALFPGKTCSAFKLPVWWWGSNTLSIVKVSIQQQLPGPHSTFGPSQLPINPFVPGGEVPWSWVSVLCRGKIRCSISSKHFFCFPQLPWAAVAASVL